MNDISIRFAEVVIKAYGNMYYYNISSFSGA